MTAANEINRVSTANCEKVSTILSDICKELQGDKTLQEAMASKLYCDCLELQMKATARCMKHDRKKMDYDRIEDMSVLLRKLYDRLSYYHHECCAKGHDLPGIEWNLDGKGVFVVCLDECALNMEHPVKVTESDGAYEIGKTGKAFNVWLDVPDLEADYPDGVGDDFPVHNYIGFCTDFGGDCEDVCFKPNDHDPDHLDLVRDILADFDVIGEMAGRQGERRLRTKIGGQHHEEF